MIGVSNVANSTYVPKASNEKNRHASRIRRKNDAGARDAAWLKVGSRIPDSALWNCQNGTRILSSARNVPAALRSATPATMKFCTLALSHTMMEAPTAHL